MRRVTIGGLSKTIPKPSHPLLIPHGYRDVFPSAATFSGALMRQHLRWMLQKDMLGQDMFLLGPPGATRRRLVQWYCELTGREVEWVCITRDTSDGDLQQRREIRGGSLYFDDQGPVRAARHGRLLVLEGVEKAERNVLPILNNLLENREMNLPDGTHLKVTNPEFRVVALGLPVPRYPGYPLDPPFRSRFQCRLVSTVPSVEVLMTILNAQGIYGAAAEEMATVWEYIQQNALLPGPYESMFTGLDATQSLTQQLVARYPVWSMSLPSMAEEVKKLEGLLREKPQAAGNDDINLNENQSTAPRLQLSGNTTYCIVGGTGTGKSTIVRDATAGQRHVITVQCYRDMTTRELLMRREVDDGGNTVWVPSALVTCMERGWVLVLDGVHRLDGAMLCALQPLVWDREITLADGTKYISGERYDDLLKRHGKAALEAEGVHRVHDDFHLVVLGLPPTSELPWLTSEGMSMFSLVCLPPPGKQLFTSILAREGLTTSSKLSATMMELADRLSLTPRQFRRIVRSYQKASHDLTLREVVTRCTLLPLMSSSLRDQMNPTLDELCPALSAAATPSDTEVKIPGSYVAPAAKMPSLIPDVLFYNMPYQVHILNAMIREYVSGERFFLLIGNQGTGKNKLCDRLLHLLSREREYMQLHRDTTVQSLTVSCVVHHGKVSWVDSPLVRAVKEGRMLVIDEADKAPLEVVCILKALVEDGELLLHNGEVIKVGSPDFGMIVLANRPGFPFLGNDFYKECGDVFSPYVIDNADVESELQLLRQYAPDASATVLRMLCNAFAELRVLVERGTLTYPFSTREIVNVVKHYARYPNDGIAEALRNAVVFDSFAPDILEHISQIMDKHGIPFTTTAQVSISKGTECNVETVPWPKLRGSHSGWCAPATGVCERIELNQRDVSFELTGTLKELEVPFRAPEAGQVTPHVGTLVLEELSGKVVDVLAHPRDGIIVAATSTNCFHVVAMDRSTFTWRDRLVDFSFAVGPMHYVARMDHGVVAVCLEAGFVYFMDADFVTLRQVEVPRDVYPAKATRMARRFMNVDTSDMHIASSGSDIVILNSARRTLAWFRLDDLAKPCATAVLSRDQVVAGATSADFVGDVLVVVAGDNVRYYALQGTLVVCSDETSVTMNSSGTVLKSPRWPRCNPDITFAQFKNALAKVDVREGSATLIPDVGTIVSASDDLVICRTKDNDALQSVEFAATASVLSVRCRNIPIPVADRRGAVVAGVRSTNATSSHDWVLCTQNGTLLFMSLGEAALNERFATATNMAGSSQHLTEVISIQEDGDGDGSTGTGGASASGSGSGGSGGAGSGGSGSGAASGAGGGNGGDLESSGNGGYIISKEGKLRAQEIRNRVQSLVGVQTASSTSRSPREYSKLLLDVGPMVKTLKTVWSNAAAREKERVWARGQTQGELDDSRVVDVMIGETNVFKRRAQPTPVLGLPQRRPKYIEFVMDASASMTRFNTWDRRLDICAQALVMVMESIAGFHSKMRFAARGHSGTTSKLPLVTFQDDVRDLKVRTSAVDRLISHSSTCVSGDHTMDAVREAAEDLSTIVDADDRIVIAFSDANLGAYGVTPEELHCVINHRPNVNVYVIFVAEPNASRHLIRSLPPLRAHFVSHPSMIPVVVHDLLQHTTTVG